MEGEQYAHDTRADVFECKSAGTVSTLPAPSHRGLAHLDAAFVRFPIKHLPRSEVVQGKH